MMKAAVFETPGLENLRVRDNLEEPKISDHDVLIQVKVVSLARRGIIKPLVSNRFNLNQATEALQMLKDGKIVGRGVINP
jgi:D-arabinose 1-dehydrogenase-like Zn-dependent alcohol dehydrogenase